MVAPMDSGVHLAGSRSVSRPILPLRAGRFFHCVAIICVLRKAPSSTWCLRSQPGLTLQGSKWPMFDFIFRKAARLIRAAFFQKTLHSGLKDVVCGVNTGGVKEHLP